MTFFSRTIVLFLLAKPLMGLAIDLQSNDIVAPPPDKTYLMLSYFATENTTNYRNGSVVSSAPYGSPVINNLNLILRATRSYTHGDLPGLTFAQLPYGTIQPAVSLANYPTSTGIGDFTLATAIWPYANRETRTLLIVLGQLFN